MKHPDAPEGRTKHQCNRDKQCPQERMRLGFPPTWLRAVTETSTQTFHSRDQVFEVYERSFIPNRLAQRVPTHMPIVEIDTCGGPRVDGTFLATASPWGLLAVARVPYYRSSSAGNIGTRASRTDDGVRRTMRHRMETLPHIALVSLSDSQTAPRRRSCLLNGLSDVTPDMDSGPGQSRRGCGMRMRRSGFLRLSSGGCRIDGPIISFADVFIQQWCTA